MAVVLTDIYFPKNMKLSDYVADFLVKNGVRHIFVLPGGGCMHLADSVGQRGEIEYVCCLHEQACAFAAEAYGEYSNTLGCALVTAGPGGTNAITGVACAWIEGAPLLIVSGQAKRADLIGSRPRPVRSMGPQEVDIVSMVRPVTKFAAMITDPLTIREKLEEALWQATHGRKGPVWIDIPLDVQASQIEPSALRGFEPPVEDGVLLEIAIAKIVDSLMAARRPVLYVGNGVRSGDQIEAFRELVKILGIPVLLSWKAMDFLPEEAEEYIGRPGSIGQRAANFTQQKADWILVLGARLDLPSVAFSHEGFAPRAYKIYVDVDVAELEKFSHPLHVTICKDLNILLPALLHGARQRIQKVPAWETWLSECRGWVRRFPVVLPEHRAENHQFISTYLLVDVLSDLAQSDDVFVPGSSGPCSDIFMQAFRVKAGQRILNAPGLGAMGTGLPGAIGACLAGNRRRVINVNGDGGFQLNIQDLETVRRLALPIKYFVLDNGGYRSIVAMQRTHFKGRLVASDPSSHLTLPDMSKVGLAYGLSVFYVEDTRQLRQVVRETLESAGPAICVVKTSVNEVTIPRVAAEVRPDGTIVSKPMEDMSPLLAREEFVAIMGQADAQPAR